MLIVVCFFMVFCFIGAYLWLFLSQQKWKKLIQYINQNFFLTNFFEPTRILRTFWESGGQKNRSKIVGYIFLITGFICLLAVIL